MLHVCACGRARHSALSSACIRPTSSSEFHQFTASPPTPHVPCNHVTMKTAIDQSFLLFYFWCVEIDQVGTWVMIASDIEHETGVVCLLGWMENGICFWLIWKLDAKIFASICLLRHHLRAQCISRFSLENFNQFLSNLANLFDFFWKKSRNLNSFEKIDLVGMGATKRTLTLSTNIVWEEVYMFSVSKTENKE